MRIGSPPEIAAAGPRAALIARGWTVGGLYRPMNNRYFNAHYAATMHRLGEPVFPRGRAGTGRGAVG